MNQYLIKVLIFLKQELPNHYRDCIELSGNKFVIDIPGDASFSSVYEEVHKLITTSINRVRVREYDLEFNVKTKYQERDFKILK